MKRKQQAFTLVEMAVVMGLISMIMLVVLTILRVSTSFLEHESRTIELENRAQVVLSRLARELKDASAQTVSATPNQVSFQPCIGYDKTDKSLVLGPAVTYQIKPGTEKLVRRIGGTETVICNRAKSLTVAAYGSRRAVITLLLERAGKPTNQKRQFFTSIWIANP